MARILYFDCFSGAAGDMLLGACLDAGLPEAALRGALGSLGVGHELRVSRVMRAGVAATHVAVVDGADGDHGHDHGHHDHGHEHVHDHEGHAHGHHEGHDRAHSHEHGHTHEHAHGPGHEAHGQDAHRSLAEIADLIGHSALSTAGKARAVALFERLGEAEAAIHNVPLDRVHLHEVGATDSIIDIVGFVYAMEWFGVTDVEASPLNVGGGTVEIAHGTFPVPAPATVRLLAGVPVYSSGPRVELVTPTGALLVSAYARAYGPMPAMTIAQVGYGAGTRDFERTPNVVRLLIGERHARQQPGGDVVLKLECEIDDMNPQLFAPAVDRLFAAGALDVFLTPVQMKKGRPGSLLTVLAPVDRRHDVTGTLFRETTTIGVRVETVERETLDRRWVNVETSGGSVRVKVAERAGEIMNAAPEFDDCLRIAEATGRPVKDVHAEALAAWGRVRALRS